ncbi:hypothetical protein ACP4OV_026126 [Aristida adscensionis]
MASSSTDTAAAGQWADLLPELCSLVLDRLDAFDLLRFAAVCKPWAAACKATSRHHLRPGAPTLLTSGLHPNDAATTFALHDVSTGNSFHAAAAAGLGGGRWWVGGKDDWLVTTDGDCNVELLHPGTGDRIRLPPFTTIPTAKLEKTLLSIEKPRCVYAFQQVRLCRTPAHPDGYFAVAQFGHAFLAFTVAGDEGWTPLRNHLQGYVAYEDAIAHGGKIFAVSWDGDVFYWSIDGGAGDHPAVVHAPPELRMHRWLRQSFSLAPSSGGGDGRVLVVCTYGPIGLLRGTWPPVVRKKVHAQLAFIHATGALLLELDVARGDTDGAWRRVSGLDGGGGGGRALFLGASYPFYVAVPPHGSNGLIRANCVYHAHMSCHDAVVFDLGKGCAGGFEPLVYPNAGNPLHTPMWFRPSAPRLDFGKER